MFSCIGEAIDLDRAEEPEEEHAEHFGGDEQSEDAVGEDDFIGVIEGVGDDDGCDNCCEEEPGGWFGESFFAADEGEEGD